MRVKREAISAQRKAKKALLSDSRIYQIPLITKFEIECKFRFEINNLK